jgi:predicted transcriptional regulator
MKEQFTVYLEPDLMRSLTEYAERRGKPKSLVAEAAIASFLSPDASERREATLARPLDRITRQMERLERYVGISDETVALFVRFWLMSAPSLPEQTQPAACAKGAERYESFLQALGRRLAKGPGFIQEVRIADISVG